MTCKLQSTLVSSRIEWLALRNHIPFMVHIIKLACGEFISGLGVKGRSQAWEAHERNHKFREYTSIGIGKSQRLRIEGNARINKVLAMGPGVPKILEKAHISSYFESPETDLHMAENACSVDRTDTSLSKKVPCLCKSQCVNHVTTDDRCKDMVEVNTRVTWVSLPITRNHPWVAQESKIK